MMDCERSGCVLRSPRRVPLIAVALAAAVALSAPDAFAQNAKGKRPTTFNVLPITVTSVTPSSGQLAANGLVGTTSFHVPITLRPGELAANAVCPILDLSLGPINLTLLGLNVDTSAICLRITAIQGGGLLGDLLCGIANLLNSGIPLADILAGLTAEDLRILDAGLTQVLNQAVFVPMSSSEALQEASCSVLSLALGPLDLNLLGLRVELDDCEGGPVTVDITATPGGGLLGDLLCSLSNLLNNNSSQTARMAVLRNLARRIGALVG